MRCLLLLGCWMALCLPAAGAPLTVVTWNARWFPGGRPNASEFQQRTQMREAQAIVKALNPDVLLLQEVADWRAAQELCSVVPGLVVHTVSNFSTRPQNLVVASRLPADSAWYAPWEPTLGEDLPPRGYAFAALRLPNGGLLLTYSVHFKSNLGDVAPNIPIRQEAAKQLLAHGKAMAALYAPRGRIAVLIGGDFNSDPGAPGFEEDTTLALLRDAHLEWVFKDVPRTKRVTIPASGRYPAGTFDHLLYGGLKLIEVRVANGVPTSDHHPVLARFRP